MSGKPSNGLLDDEVLVKPCVNRIHEKRPQWTVKSSSIIGLMNNSDFARRGKNRGATSLNIIFLCSLLYLCQYKAKGGGYLLVYMDK